MVKTTTHFRVDVGQLGRRMHYAVPRYLYKTGVLGVFFTDLWKPNLEHDSIASVFAPFFFGHKLNSRVHLELISAQVQSNTLLGLSYALKLKVAHSRSGETRTFLSTAKQFTRWVNTRRQTVGDAFYGFNSASLEIFEHPSQKNRLNILEQTIAPRKIERLILEKAASKFGTSVQTDLFSAEYEAREEQEWKAADLIICASSFVKDALVKCGATENKIRLVPYGYDLKGENPAVVKRASRPLRLLFVGNGFFRKGLPDLLSALDQMSLAVDLHVVGFHGFPQIELPDRKKIIFHGLCSSKQVSDLMNHCHVFCLPSLCEGSATVVYEAQAHGMPCVVTPNTGSHIRDGKDGFIIPLHDPSTLAEALSRFKDAGLLSRMSQNSLTHSRSFSTDEYGRKLFSTISEAL